MAEGNKHLEYKAVLNDLEVRSPGAKQAVYFGFQERAAEQLAGAVADDPELGSCRDCGAPTPNEVCSFCRLASRASVELTGRLAEAVAE